MRLGWGVIWLAMAGAAGAAPYCQPDAAQVAALPVALVGAWEGRLERAMAVVEGKPVQMPLSDTPTPVQIHEAAGGIGLLDGAMAQAMVLVPVTGDAEFALPGESPLGLVEFLGPVLAEVGVRCAPLDLPQFQGEVAQGRGMVVRFRALVLSDRQMVVVMMVEETAEPRMNGMRAVLRYSR